MITMNCNSAEKVLSNFPRHKGRQPSKTVPATYSQSENINANNHRHTLFRILQTEEISRSSVIYNSNCFRTATVFTHSCIKNNPDNIY